MYYASSKSMEKLDALAVGNGLEIRQMMELAGWHIVEAFEKLKMQSKSRVVVVCGKGNKGGDGLCAARHLINHGWNVEVVMAAKSITKDAKHQLRLLSQMEVPIFYHSEDKERVKETIARGNILIDALIGYHLKGSPRGVIKDLIILMDAAKKKIISYDIPSGMDATTGECREPYIRATATLTLALPKKAFKTKESRKVTGKIFVADIGIPNFLYDKIAINSRPGFEEFDDFFIEL